MGSGPRQSLSASAGVEINIVRVDVRAVLGREQGNAQRRLQVVGQAGDNAGDDAMDLRRELAVGHEDERLALWRPPQRRPRVVLDRCRLVRLLLHAVDEPVHERQRVSQRLAGAVSESSTASLPPRIISKAARCTSVGSSMPRDVSAGSSSEVEAGAAKPSGRWRTRRRAER